MWSPGAFSSPLRWLQYAVIGPGFLLASQSEPEISDPYKRRHRQGKKEIKGWFPLLEEQTLCHQFRLQSPELDHSTRNSFEIIEDN